MRKRRRLILVGLVSLVLIAGFWEHMSWHFAVWLGKKCQQQTAPPAPSPPVEGESGGGHGGGGGGAW